MVSKSAKSERTAKLARTRAEFAKALAAAGEMLRGTEKPGRELKGEALARFIEADAKATALRQRIVELEKEL